MLFLFRRQINKTEKQNWLERWEEQRLTTPHPPNIHTSTFIPYPQGNASGTPPNSWGSEEQSGTKGSSFDSWGGAALTCPACSGDEGTQSYL